MSERPDIPLEAYRIFCAVARTGSVTLAANELFVTQPSVSMAIKRLEVRLGRALFARSRKGVRLTSEGRMLYTYIERALGLIDAAEQKYLEMADMRAGEIIIGASDTMAGRYLLPYLERFNSLYKNINIKVLNRTTKETLNVLKSGDIDFGFVNLPIEQDDALEVKKCMDIHDCLIGGSEYAAYRERGLKLSELPDYPLIMLERESITRRLLDDYAESNGVGLRPIIELGSSDLLVKFARINLGVSFAIREFVEDEVDGESLFFIPLEPPPPPRAVGLVKLRGIPFSFAAEGFLRLMDIGAV